MQTDAFPLYYGKPRESHLVQREITKQLTEVN